MYTTNTIPHVKCFVRYLPTRFCIRNLTRSLRSLVRFLIQKQLVCKYRTPALSMKYSLLDFFNGIMSSFYWNDENVRAGIMNTRLYRGYYTVARRYECYFRVAKQYFTHSLRSFENIVLPLENKIHIVAPPCNILYVIDDRTFFISSKEKKKNK